MKRSVMILMLAAIALVFSSCGAAAGKSTEKSVSEVIQKVDTSAQDKSAAKQSNDQELKLSSGSSNGTKEQSTAKEVKEAEKGKSMNSSANREVATLAGGCFWCLEAVYNDLRGVEKVVSGYSNGHVINPTYEQVCTGKTGHAEVVQITFNPQEISFKELLEVFFTIHDPTTLNQQGADVGTQYRSAIFWHTEEQKVIAEKVIAEITAAKIWDDPIVTEVKQISNYSAAEDYHQLYFERNPNAGYCRVVIAPKVNKFRKQFIGKLKKPA